MGSMFMVLLFYLSCEVHKVHKVHTVHKVHKVHKVKKTQMVKKVQMLKCKLCSWCCPGSFPPSPSAFCIEMFRHPLNVEKSWYDANIANSVQYHLFLSFQKHCHEFLFSNISLVLKCSVVSFNYLILARQRELLIVKYKENYWESLDSFRLTWLMWPR